MLAACGAAAAGIALPRSPRTGRSRSSIAVVAAPILVIADVWNEPRVADFRDSRRSSRAALVARAALVGRARPWRSAAGPEVLPIAAIAVLPIRVPIEIGGETANLLVPLYLVIAAGVLARCSPSAARRRRPAAAAGDPGRSACATSSPRASSSTRSRRPTREDVSNAVENIGFFLAPFAVLFCLLSEIEWSRGAAAPGADRRRRGRGRSAR